MAEKTLSIFIDESGDFGPFDSHAPFYLVTMVLHEQDASIADGIRILEDHVQNLGFDAHHAIHTGPLIRRESIYCNHTIEERRQLFHSLFHFARRAPIHYISVCVRKSECRDIIDLTAKLSRAISEILRRHEPYFTSFDRIIVYYDNGQVELTKILTSVFYALYSHVEFCKVQPVDYKLFQVADLICTLELLAAKGALTQFSSSEHSFFGSVRDFKKNYLKNIQKKLL